MAEQSGKWLEMKCRLMEMAGNSWTWMEISKMWNTKVILLGFEAASLA